MQVAAAGLQHLVCACCAHKAETKCWDMTHREQDGGLSVDLIQQKYLAEGCDYTKKYR
jgi:hypothetical protein